MKVGIYASFQQRDTLLKEREKRVKESEELLKAGQKLSAVLQTLPVGVIIADTQGRIVQTNDTVFEICQLTDPIKSDAYGDFLIWWEKDGHFFKEKFLSVVKSSISTHNEIIKIHCINEVRKTVLSSISPLRGLNDRIVGSVAVVQDISEHQKVEKDLEQRILKLISLGVEFEQMSSP